MSVPIQAPRYDGDPFALENYKVSARAFFIQSKQPKCELTLKHIQSKIKIRIGGSQRSFFLVKGGTIDSFLKTVKDRVYNSEYLREWIASELAQTKKGPERVSLCARWAREARKTRVEMLKTIMFSEWFRKVASAALPPWLVKGFEVSASPQADEGERSRLFVEFVYKFNPTNSEGRESENKGPRRYMCDQGHQQQGNDPRGLATP